MAFGKSLEGIGERIVTFGKSGTITKGTHEGQVATVVAGPAVKVSASTNKVAGIIKKINDDNIGVQIGGIMKADYSGSAPTAGAVNNLEADGSGGVNVDAGNGDPFFVWEVDTTNTKVYFSRAL